ncbi:hypothetical protein CVT24_006629 [Panaeolus cyanescens]|uniref:Uncharacterized protein n=1 Tax=Panaeolus cyanescens TaxID=181874 RepID=A0A409YS68_9AGAR|nr:hypothetical protein CVT24_006629 [Panaeolus cyanescens]
MKRAALFAGVIAVCLSQLVYASVVTVYAVNEPRPTRTRDPIDTVSYIQPSVEWAGTELVTAIGPGESGRTKYEIKYIQSLYVIHISGTDPKTWVSEPMTATYTHEQGGNILIEKGDAAISTVSGGGTIHNVGLDMECVLDDKHELGVCSGENMYAELTEVVDGTQTVLSTYTTTVPTTYTGSVIPVATITTSAAASLYCTRSAVLTLVAMVLGAFVAY